MERWQLQACMSGFEERMNDYSALAVYAGYWSAYYSNNRKAKSPSKIVAEMQRTETRKEKPELDVGKFLAMEADFQARMAQKKGEQDERGPEV